MGVTMNKTSNLVKFKGIILTLTGGCFWGLLAALFLAVYTNTTSRVTELL